MYAKFSCNSFDGWLLETLVIFHCYCLKFNILYDYPDWVGNWQPVCPFRFQKWLNQAKLHYGNRIIWGLTWWSHIHQNKSNDLNNNIPNDNNESIHFSIIPNNKPEFVSVSILIFLPNQIYMHDFISDEWFYDFKLHIKLLTTRYRRNRHFCLPFEIIMTKWHFQEKYPKFGLICDAKWFCDQNLAFGAKKFWFRIFV